MSLAFAFLFGLAVAQTTPTPDANRISSIADECPLGWVDAGNLGCFLFMTEEAGISWGEALELCELQVCFVFLSYFLFQGGVLAEPKTLKQLSFVTGLAYLVEGCNNVDAW